MAKLPALSRKYSDVISDALRQTKGQPTILALQCTHIDIAHDAAMRKMRAGHPHLLAVWINPLRQTQRIAFRGGEHSPIVDLISSAHIHGMRFAPVT